MNRVSCVLDVKAQSGETPVWSVAEQCLYWVDQQAFKLNRFDPATRENVAWSMPAHVSSFALRGPEKKILVALRTGLFDFDVRSQTLEPVVVPPPYDVGAQRFNDGRCDRQGRYIVGSVDLAYFEKRHNVRGQAALYRLDDRGLAAIAGDITVSNGLAFSPDGRTLYLADTTVATVYAFDYDVATGTPSNRRVFTRFEKGRPDGADVDSEGGYWIALLMKGVIARYRPDGTLDFEIRVPVLQPTKVAFGGRDLATLYLTTASYRHIPGDQPMGEQAGGLFAIETGYRGIEEPRFAY
jgi:sugar lactone lactonase YvrE